MSSRAELALVLKVVDQASADLDRIERKAGGLGSAFSGLGRTAAIGAAGVASGLGLLGGVVAKVGFDFNSMRQQAEIAFTTMLGSGERAKTFLDDLQQFAAKTPFEFPELVQASQKMLAMGFAADKIKPTLTAIGDAVAGLGGSSAMVDRVTTALGQMLAKGKVSAEEMLQLTEAGIPAWDILAKRIGVSIPEAMKLAEKGAIDSQTAVAALTEGMNERFGGMMEKQSQTAQGLISTLKDTFSQTAGMILQQSGAFDAITAALHRVAEVTSSPGFQEGVRDFASGLGEAARQGAEFARTVGPPIIDAITQIVATVQEHWPEIQRIIESVIAAIRPQVEDAFAFIVAQAERVRAWFDEEWPHIQEAVEHVVNAIRALWSEFGDEFQRVAEIAVGQVKTQIETIVTTVTSVITLITALINGDWSRAWQALKTIAEAQFKLFRTTIENQVKILTTLLSGLGAAAKEAAGDLGKTLFKAGVDLIQGLIDGIESKVDEVKRKLGSITSKIPDWKGPEDEDERLLYESGQLIMSGLISGITSKISDLQTALGAVTSTIAAEVEENTEPIVDMITEALYGDISEIAPEIDAITEDISTSFDEMGERAEEAICSTNSRKSLRQAFSCIKSITAETATDVEKHAESIVNAVTSIAEEVDVVFDEVEEHAEAASTGISISMTRALGAMQNLDKETTASLFAMARAFDEAEEDVGGALAGITASIASTIAEMQRFDKQAAATATAAATVKTAVATAMPAAPAPYTTTSRSAGGTVRATHNYGGVAGATLYTFTDPEGNEYETLSVTDEILEAYGGNLEAAKRDIERKAREKRRMARGGIIPEHVVGVGLASGRMYEFGEQGPETVTPGAGRGGIHIYFQGPVYGMRDFEDAVATIVRDRARAGGFAGVFGFGTA